MLSTINGAPNEPHTAAIPSAMSFDSRRFRDALGCFPTGVAIVTTSDANGKPVGLTCNSFSSVSLEPPLVLWSLRTTSKSVATFQNAGAFVINVLAEDQNILSNRFASSSIVNKFEGVSVSSGLHGIPIINACLASFECTTFAQYDAGDHVIFIGRVERFEHAGRADPLVFYRGMYMMLAQSLRELVSNGRIPAASFDEARAGLYDMLVRLACTNGRNEDFDEIEAHLHVMERFSAPESAARWVQAGVEFLDLITRAAQNEVLGIVATSFTTILHHKLAVSTGDYNASLRIRPELVPIRWRILASLRARNADDAARAMADYAEHARSDAMPAIGDK